MSDFIAVDKAMYSACIVRAAAASIKSVFKIILSQTRRPAAQVGYSQNNNNSKQQQQEETTNTYPKGETSCVCLM
jgi:fatty acid-binding protein DegV